MLDFLKPRPSSEAQAEIATYQTIRAASRSWFPKVMDNPGTKGFNIVKAARKLRLPVDGRAIVFDDELEQAMLMDFFLFDYRPARLTPAESCTFAEGELEPLEAEFHQAGLTSRLSLFEVVEIHEQLPRLLLRDLLHRDAPDVWLTDLNFSASFRRLGPALLYTRVCSLRGLHITGGFSLVFELAHQAALIDGYQRAMWSIPRAKQAQQRTPHFYAQHLRHGVRQTFGEPS